MSMCDCNQGRLPCTCKPIEGATVMSELKRYYAGELPANDYVIKAADFDRVTAERDALQERLNAADQGKDDLSFQLNDREGSRRDWFEEAQKLEKRYCCLANDQLELVKELDALRAKLAERDALLEDWHTANATGEVKVSDKAYRIVTRTAAALSASAEPKCSKCGDSGVIDDKETDELPGGHFTERGLVACPDCEELSTPKCKTCQGVGEVYTGKMADQGWHQPPEPIMAECPDCKWGAPVERDERADTAAAAIVQTWENRHE